MSDPAMHSDAESKPIRCANPGGVAGSPLETPAPEPACEAACEPACGDVHSCEPAAAVGSTASAGAAVGTAIAPQETEVGDYFIANYPPFSVWQSEQVPAFEAALGQGSVEFTTVAGVASASAGHVPMGGSSGVQRRPLGLYVHLPFCRQRCYYCYFRVHPNVRPAVVDEYIGHVLKEAALYRAQAAVGGRKLRHVYIGGGTPTYLDLSQLGRLIVGLKDVYAWHEVEEFTVEADPGTVSPEKLEILHALGVNRISMGFQTLTPGLGFRIGRLSGRQNCIEAYWAARSAGIETINVDMLAGLQGEILESWLWSVSQVADLEPDSITMCQMQLTHNSKYYAMRRSGRSLPLPTWNEKRDWVQAAFDLLEKRGYRVVDGYTAVRQMNGRTAAYTADTLWRGEDLLALGESSFGLLAGYNYQNADTLETWSAALKRDQLPVRRAWKLSAEDRFRREVVLLLKSGWLGVGYFQEKYGKDVRAEFREQWDLLTADGLVEIDERRIALTRAGLLQVDGLLPLFYAPAFAGVRYT